MPPGAVWMVRGAAGDVEARCRRPWRPRWPLTSASKYRICVLREVGADGGVVLAVVRGARVGYQEYTLARGRRSRGAD